MEQAEAGLKNERILWVDFAKVIGIWLVYLGHSHVSPMVGQYIYSFHMPLFFFISGYLEKKRAFKESIIHGMKTLIVPYILLYLLLFISWIPSRILYHPELFEGQSNINILLVYPMIGIISGFGINIKNTTVIFRASWFLITLFYIKLIHSIVTSILKNRMIMYLLSNIPILGVFFVLNHFEINDVLYAQRVMIAFPFFSLGYYIRTIKPCGKIMENIRHNIFLRIIIIFIRLVR
jgi:fucose 4-O-acetylase-like acetyltransferase